MATTQPDGTVNNTAFPDELPAGEWFALPDVPAFTFSNCTPRMMFIVFRAVGAGAPTGPGRGHVVHGYLTAGRLSSGVPYVYSETGGIYSFTEDDRT